MLNSLATGSAFVLRHWFYDSGGYLPAPVLTSPPPPLLTTTGGGVADGICSTPASKYHRCANECITVRRELKRILLLDYEL